MKTTGSGSRSNVQHLVSVFPSNVYTSGHVKCLKMGKLKPASATLHQSTHIHTVFFTPIACWELPLPHTQTHTHTRTRTHTHTLLMHKKCISATSELHLQSLSGDEC